MKLSDFIRSDINPILDAWEEFAGTIPSAKRMKPTPDAPPVIDEDLVRFNEAIDQALSESVARYSRDKETIARLFDTLLSSSPDLNFIVDVEGNVVYANKAMADLYRIVPNTIPNIGVIDGPGPTAGIRQKLHE